MDGNKSKLTTEIELQAYTIGELKPLTTPILLSDYSPDWPVLYEREAARVRRLLGSRVKLLLHVGSTSVVALPVKPIIDMVLAVPDSSDEATYVRDMELGGYVLRIREPHWFEHRVFNALDTKVNLHVFTVGCSEIAQMRFVQHYADAKTEIVHEILARAGASTEEPG
ncbi:MAG: hypothetical protein RJA70_3092 [Pseudomonadota bacterium]